MCGEKNDYQSVVLIYFELDGSDVMSTSTTYYTDSSTTKTCAGLYVDSTVSSARMLYFDDDNNYYMQLYISDLTSTGSSLSGLE
jgi:hypothetical protein